MSSVALVSYLLSYELMTNSSRQYIHRVTTLECSLLLFDHLNNCKIHNSSAVNIISMQNFIAPSAAQFVTVNVCRVVQKTHTVCVLLPEPACRHTVGKLQLHGYCRQTDRQTNRQTE